MLSFCIFLLLLQMFRLKLIQKVLKTEFVAMDFYVIAK